MEIWRKENSPRNDLWFMFHLHTVGRRPYGWPSFRRWNRSGLPESAPTLTIPIDSAKYGHTKTTMSRWWAEQRGKDHSLCMTQWDQTRERDNGCLMSCLASCRSARSVPKSFTNQVRDWINHIFYINRFTVQIVWLDIIYNANQSRTN